MPIQYNMIDAMFLQIIAGGESGLASANDDGVNRANGRCLLIHVLPLQNALVAHARGTLGNVLCLSKSIWKWNEARDGQRLLPVPKVCAPSFFVEKRFWLLVRGRPRLPPKIRSGCARFDWQLADTAAGHSRLGSPVAIQRGHWCPFPAVLHAENNRRNSD